VEHSKYFAHYFPGGIPKDFDGWMYKKFLPFYEGVMDMFYAFEKRLESLLLWQKFRQSGDNLTDKYPGPHNRAPNYVPTWESETTIRSYPIGLTYSSRLNGNKRTLHLEYTFRSLLKAIDVMLIYDRLDPMPIRVCEGGEPFIPRHPSRKFCRRAHQELYKKRHQRSLTRQKQ
jgi:hypothetical protein